MDPFSMGSVLNAANAPNYAFNFASTPHHTNATNNLYGFAPPPVQANPLPTPYKPSSMSNMLPSPARLDARFLRTLFVAIAMRNANMPLLPPEIQDDIISMVTGNSQHLSPTKPEPVQPSAPAKHPALTPPSSGASHFTALPAELRRQIFAGSLTDRLVAIQPRCDGREGGSKPKQKNEDQKFDKYAHNIPNLMTICQRVCKEITEVMYDERTFVIHVHEGLRFGGVELLNAGRQPLQYQDSTEDKRFRKLGHGEEFGFRRMKKVIIQIHPTTEDQDRHLALNTHFMNLALCRLLERPTNDKERITSIRIEFVARNSPATDRSTKAAIMRHEKPWMDVNGPKQSSIHNVSDVELLLRPFAMLTRCHRASIELPSYLAGDPHLSSFVADLEHSMTSKTGTLMPNDTLEHKVEQLRQEMEAHVVGLLYGNGNRVSVARLTDAEIAEDAGYDDSDPDDPDEGVGLPVSKSMRSNKHPRSASDAAGVSSPAKRSKNEQENNEATTRKELTTAVKDSLKVAGVKKTVKQISQIVDDLMNGEEVEFSGGGLVKKQATAKRKRKARKQESSLLDDLELAEMDEDVQADLAIQLSMGKSRKELGLRESPTSLESGAAAQEEEEEEGGTQLERIKQRSRSDIEYHSLEVMDGPTTKESDPPLTLAPTEDRSKFYSEFLVRSPGTTTRTENPLSTLLGNSAAALGHGSANHSTTTIDATNDQAGEDVDAGQESMELETQSESHASSQDDLFASQPSIFGNEYRSTATTAYASATPPRLAWSSANHYAEFGNGYYIRPIAAQAAAWSPLLGGPSAPSSLMANHNHDHSATNDIHAGTTSTYSANLLAPRPSIFSSGYNQSSISNTQDPLVMHPGATPRDFLQAEDSGIGMLSSDENTAKWEENAEEVEQEVEEMMEGYVDY